MPPKRARVEEEVQMNETMESLNETKVELERVRKTMLRTEEDRHMWSRLFEHCKNKQGEMEGLRQKHKERSERLGLAIAMERSLPVGMVPRGQCTMELLTPRELSQTTEVQIPAAPGRVTILIPVTPWMIQ